MMIDTHCHLSKKDYDNIDDVIKNMKNNIMIVSSASPDDLMEIIELCEKYDNIYGTIGIHPEYASTYTINDIKLLEKYLKHPKIVGIGEIGLDYYYTKDNIKQQKRLFSLQLDLACKYNIPIVVHTRNSLDDAYNILKQYKNIKGIMHCFSGDINYAYKIIDLNMYLGIGGILTFKNEKTLKEVVKEIDIKHFVLETDSPYLTPEPLRGHKNEPVNIKYVAKKIADIKKENITKIFEITTNNASSLFDLKL